MKKKDWILPTPYSKEHQPFEHFDHPEDLARDRIRMDIESGWADHDQVCGYHGWYGHGTEVNHDKLTVLECAGQEMKVVFSYHKLLEEERRRMPQLALFV